MENVVVIDNYDSFTYNLVHALKQITGSTRWMYSGMTRIRSGRPGSSTVTYRTFSRDRAFRMKPGMLKDIIRKICPGKKNTWGMPRAPGHRGGVRRQNWSISSRVFHGVSTRIKVLDREDYLYQNIPARI